MLTLTNKVPICTPRSSRPSRHVRTRWQRANPASRSALVLYCSGRRRADERNGDGGDASITQPAISRECYATNAIARFHGVRSEDDFGSVQSASLAMADGAAQAHCNVGDVRPEKPDPVPGLGGIDRGGRIVISETVIEALIRPASGSTAAVVREAHPRFQRRLQRGYLRFDDGLPRPSPNRRSMNGGSEGIAGTGISNPFLARARSIVPRTLDQREARLLGLVRPLAARSVAHCSISGRSQSMQRPRPRVTTGRGMSAYRCW